MNHIYNFWRLLQRNEKRKIAVISALQIFLSCLDWLLWLILYLIIATITGTQVKAPSTSLTEPILLFVHSRIEESALTFYLLLLALIYIRIILNLTLQFFLVNIFDKAQRRISHEILVEISSTRLAKETHTIQEISYTMINAVDAAILVTLGSTVTLIVDSALLLLLLIPLIIYSPFVLIIVLALAVSVSLYFQRFTSRSVKKVSYEETNSYLKLVNFIAGFISILKEARLAGKIPHFLAEFDRLRSLNSFKVTRRNYLQLLPKYFLEGVIALLLIGFAMVSTLNQMQPKEVVVLSTFLVFIAIRIFPIILRVQASIINIESWHSVSNLIFEAGYFKFLLEKNTKTANAALPKSENVQALHSEVIIGQRVAIRLHNVSFSYQNDLPLILDSVNFEVFEGDFIGIIGPSGSGKSTFIDLVCGFLTPTSGNLEILGDDVIEYIENNPGAVAVVPQDVEIFQGTIAENICMLPDVSDEAQLRRATDLASLVGLNYIDIGKEIGPAIGRLSGGEKQRLGLARALFGNPTVLIFDEATSSLDKDSQSKIIEILNDLKGSITILAIAHRLETIVAADKVVSIRNGILMLEEFPI